MMKSSTFFRSLSTRIMPSPAVAPWPPVWSAYDRLLAAELDELRSKLLTPPCTSAAWLDRALGLAVAAQRRLVAPSSDMASSAGIDRRKTIDECADDTTELLDACAGFQDRLDMLRCYITATRIALHWLDGHGGVVAARLCGAEFAKYGSNHRKLDVRALLRANKHPAVTIDEALSAALAFPLRCSMSGVSVSGGGAVGGRAAGGAEGRVREEYDRRGKDGVPCMAELEAAAAAALQKVQRCVREYDRRRKDGVLCTAELEAADVTSPKFKLLLYSKLRD
jgi:hypothetical protein